MKPTQERAEISWYNQPADDIASHKEMFCRGFIAGSKSEHEELTRWNDPECPPDGPHEVLAKICGGYYKVVVFDSNNRLYKVSGTQEWIEIFGWREIHE